MVTTPKSILRLLVIFLGVLVSSGSNAQTSWNSKPIADFRFSGEGSSPCSIVYTFIDSSKLLIPCNLSKDSCDTIVNYFWDFGFGFNSKSRNPSFFFPIYGDYFIKHKVTTKYGYSDSTVQLFQVLGPIPRFVVNGDTVINVGDVVEFENTSTHSVHFVDPIWKWDFGDGFILKDIKTNNSIFHEYKTPGKYEVYLNMSASLSSNVCYSIYPDPNGIFSKKIRITVKETNKNEKLGKPQLSIFPNPSSEFINFSDDVKGQIIFFDLAGNIVLETFITSNSSLNISKLRQGIYFARVNHDYRNYFIKFLKR